MSIAVIGVVRVRGTSIAWTPSGPTNDARTVSSALAACGRVGTGELSALGVVVIV